MKYLASVLVLLCVVGVGRAGEKDIIEGLAKAGVRKCVFHGPVICNETLDFEGVRGTNALLAELCELPPVEGLGLEGSDVTDTGMAAVGGLKGLKYLYLRSSGVTDAGLRQLEGLSSLGWLNLVDCPGVTDEGVARLQKALPKCHIDR
jgi:hypothetical protein